MAKRQMLLQEQPRSRPRETRRVAEAKRKLKRYLQLQRAAKRAFKEAGGLLEEIVEELGANATIDLPRGRTAIIVDNFARGNTAFKRVGFDRYSVEMMD